MRAGLGLPLALVLAGLLAPASAAAGRRKVDPAARVAPPMAEPAPPPEPEGPPPVPPEGWNTSSSDGAPLDGSRLEERWARMLEGPPLGAVATDGESLVVVTASEVAGYDLDGRILWRQPVASSGPARMGPEGAWVPGKDGQVRVFAPATGSLVRTIGEGGPAVPGPIAIEGKHGWWADAAGTVWTTAGWSVALETPLAPGVAVDSGTAFVATTAGHVAAAGREGLQWRVALDAPALYGPSLDGGQVYVAIGPTGGVAGGVCAVRRDGATQWCARSAFGPAAPLAVTEGLVILPDRDGSVYALAAADGKVRWQVEGFGAFTGRPLAAGGVVYVGNADGVLHAIDPDDGGVVWTRNLGATIEAAPTRVGDILVVPLSNGRLIALGSYR